MTFAQGLFVGLIAAMVAGGVAWGVTRSHAAGPTGVAHARMLGGEGHWKSGGGWGRRRGHGWKQLCAATGQEWIDDVSAIAKSRIGVTEDQEPAWEELMRATHEGTRTVRAACPDAAAPNDTAAGPRRLVEAETMMVAGLEALRRVRPALEGLYASLSDAQRRELDGLFAGRHKH